MDQTINPRKRNTLERNERLRKKFSHIYNVKRLRLEDALEAVAKEFCLEVISVRKILRGS